MTEKQQWAYSNYEDGEDWILAESREDAISEGQADATYDHFYIGPALFVTVDDVVSVDVDSIIENIKDGCDFMPECCEGWLDNVEQGTLKNLEQRLEAVVCNWMTENKLQPTWFNIGETERIEVENEQ